MIIAISLPYNINITSWDILSKLSIEYVKKGSHVQSVGPGYLGGVVGNWYIYEVSDTVHGNGETKDSIFALIQLNPGDFPYCPSLTSTAALRSERVQTDKRNDADTTFQYVRPYDSLAVYGGIGVYRISRFTWQGIDTCVVKLNNPIPIGSVDGDQIPDTIWFRSSPASLLSKNGDTVYSRVEVRYKLKITAGAGIDSVSVFDRYKFRLRENKGFWLISLDTSHQVYHTQYGPFPFSFTGILKKILLHANINVLERTDIRFKIVNNKIYFDRNYDGIIYIYKSNGMLEKSFYFKGNVLDLSKLKGLYIIKIGREYIKFLN